MTSNILYKCLYITVSAFSVQILSSSDQRVEVPIVQKQMLKNSYSKTLAPKMYRKVQH